MQKGDIGSHHEHPAAKATLLHLGRYWTLHFCQITNICKHSRYKWMSYAFGKSSSRISVKYTQSTRVADLSHSTTAVRAMRWVMRLLTEWRAVHSHFAATAPANVHCAATNLASRQNSHERHVDDLLHRRVLPLRKQHFVG